MEGLAMFIYSPIRTLPAHLDLIGLAPAPRPNRSAQLQYCSDSKTPFVAILNYNFTCRFEFASKSAPFVIILLLV